MGFLVVLVVGFLLTVGGIWCVGDAWQRRKLVLFQMEYSLIAFSVFLGLVCQFLGVLFLLQCLKLLLGK